MTFNHNLYKIFLVLLLVATIVLPPSYASFTSEYGEFQDDPSNRGFVHDEFGTWTEVGTTLSTAAGNTISPPLSVDIDNDGDKDIIVANGNFINIYDDTLTIIDQFNFGSAVTSYTFSNDFNNDDLPELHVYSSASDLIYIYQFNSTDFVNIINHTAVNDKGAESPPVCKSLLREYCYMVIDNGTNDYIEKWNLTWIGNRSLGSMNVKAYFPAVGDVDRDGRDEIVFVSDDDDNGQIGIMMVDENLTATDSLPFLDTGFSGDGIIDDIFSAAGAASFPIVYNLDGGGDMEVIIAGKVAAVSGVRMFVYDSTGGNFGTFPHDTAAVCGTNDPSVTMVDLGGANFDICIFDADTAACGDFNELLECVDKDENVIVQYGTDFLDTDSIVNQPLIGINLDGDSVDEIITPRGIYDPTTNNTVVNITLDGLTFSATDVDADNNVEILTTESGSTQIIFSTFTNDPPELNNSYEYGGYFGYHNPVCVNTTVTYRAQESGGLVTGNYQNDGASDDERIVTNCGFDVSGAPNTNPESSRDNGTFSGATPVFNCYYNTTGSFPVRLYLQDEFNTGDFSQFNTQTITLIVIDGDPGVTCNVPSTLVADVGDQATVLDDPTGMDESIDDTLGILFGTSSTMKTIAGLGIVIGIGVAAATLAGVIGFVGGAILAAALVTFIGLLPAWIFILVLISMVLLVILARFIVGSTVTQ